MITHSQGKNNDKTKNFKVKQAILSFILPLVLMFNGGGRAIKVAKTP